MKNISQIIGTVLLVYYGNVIGMQQEHDKQIKRIDDRARREIAPERVQERKEGLYFDTPRQLAQQEDQNAWTIENRNISYLIHMRKVWEEVQLQNIGVLLGYSQKILEKRPITIEQLFVQSPLPVQTTVKEKRYQSNQLYFHTQKKWAQQEKMKDKKNKKLPLSQQRMQVAHRSRR